MMSTWEDLDESSIESEEVKEEANFRLIAYANLDNEVKYELEQLHDAYDELVEESNCLSNLDISLFSTLAPKEVRTQNECKQIKFDIWYCDIKGDLYKNILERITVKQANGYIYI